jgi:subtilisin family serine protease
VTVAIADTGVDANADNNTAVAHADVRGRQVAFVDYSTGAAPTDTNGHGTHVAGIAVGNAASGQVEAVAPENFLWGQGMAPDATYVNQNFLDDDAGPQPATDVLIKDSVTNGAQVMNNSWGVDNDGGEGYTALTRLVDLCVRDPNPGTPVPEHLAIVFSAGNAGGRPSSLTSPHEAKNAIVVGNSLTARPGAGFPSEDIRGIAGMSSRGPAVDGRTLPTVVAPGTYVPSALSRTADTTFYPPIPGTGAPDPANPGQFVDQYVFRSGTSMACPHVTGACALLVEWWRNRTGGQAPSQAMLKALLVNGAEDLAGGENWRSLNSAAVDQAQWTLESGSVYRRPVAFEPGAVDNANTPLTKVADAASISAPGQWAHDAATGQLYVRNLDSTNPGTFGGGWITARDAQPLAAVPDDNQGWGRVSLANMMLQSPASDRGPKIFSDQKHAFTSAGQEYLVTVAPVDAARPLRVTVAWTDAGSAPAPTRRWSTTSTSRCSRWARGTSSRATCSRAGSRSPEASSTP